MSHKVNLRKQIYLLGHTVNQIFGCKLPSNIQVLRVLFHNIREVKLSIRDSARLVIDEVLIFWQKARIPTREVRHCILKLEAIYDEWRSLQKNASRQTDTQKKKENCFIDKFDDLFDIAHADAMNLMSIELDKQFLIRQREKGRPGSLSGIDYDSYQAEQKKYLRFEKTEKRKKRTYDEIKASYDTVKFYSGSSESDTDDDSQIMSTNDDLIFEKTLCEPGPSTSKRASKQFLTNKLVAALDRCMISDRDATHLLMAAAEAFGQNVDSLVINRSSIHREREKLRKERALNLRENFQISLFSNAVVHWDGKLLPSLTSKDLVDRLPIIISSGDHEQLLGVPKLSEGTGEEQAIKVYESIEEWGLKNSVVAVCCDTTSSNTGRLKGTCILLEQRLEKDLLYLLCRHHIYEIVLKSIFEEKFGSTSGPNVQLFKKFQEGWSNINTNKFNPGIEDKYVSEKLCDAKQRVLEFSLIISKEKQFREDYRELLELSIIFLGGIPHRSILFRVPGAFHHARWMSKAIYCLKIYIFRKQFHMTAEQERACRDICIFIICVYIERWFRSHVAIEAPYQDLSFVHCLIEYEKIDKNISKIALKKFCGHLWYLTPEVAGLSFFDSNIPLSMKLKMVQSLKNHDDNANVIKRYVVPINNYASLKNKQIYEFINSSSIKLFERFNIATDFLNQNPLDWNENDNYQKGKSLFNQLKVINDAAERGVQLISNFNEIITKDEEQKQFLIQSVYDYRKKYPDAKRSTLSREF
ncbi:uncharacterized protein LOC126895832 [Daktulosphaira vitifoliae]|uniref:uncharacterized protein LOC126895832 n=2 Tax=Daktulosphaira vitifoliae TaxID=58002 RepID=UPI0021AA9831|nr:uncharacterized protein LOC126895832 [Daktulosphaira vitifoliae]